MAYFQKSIYRLTHLFFRLQKGGSFLHFPCLFSIQTNKRHQGFLLCSGYLWVEQSSRKSTVTLIFPKNVPKVMKRTVNQTTLPSRELIRVPLFVLAVSFKCSTWPYQKIYFISNVTSLLKKNLYSIKLYPQFFQNRSSLGPQPFL